MILTYLFDFGVELYQMLSENLNRLHLPATHHPPISLFPPKNIANLLGMILLLGTHAEKGLLILALKVILLDRLQRNICSVIQEP